MVPDHSPATGEEDFLRGTLLPPDLGDAVLQHVRERFGLGAALEHRFFHLAASGLGLHEIVYLFPELVAVLRGVEGAFEHGDELLRHLDLLRVEISEIRKFQIPRLDHLIRETEGDDEEVTVLDEKGSEVLLPAHDPADNRLRSVFLQGPGEAPVRLPVVPGPEIVRSIIPEMPDLLPVDQSLDRDDPRRLRIELCQLLLLEEDVDAAADLRALPDRGRIGLLSGLGIHHLLLHGPAVRSMEEAKMDIAILERRIELDGYLLLAEPDGALPQGAYGRCAHLVPPIRRFRGDCDSRDNSAGCASRRKDCRVAKKSFHGSCFKRSRRSGTVRMLNAPGPTPSDNSSHETGVATGAPARARVE